MANIKQARKRVRQNDKRRDHNASLRSMMRTCIKKVLKLIESGNQEEALKLYQTETQPTLDRMASKGIIHRNKANRHKSRLMAHIQAIAKQ